MRKGDNGSQQGKDPIFTRRPNAPRSLSLDRGTTAAEVLDAFTEFLRSQFLCIRRLRRGSRGQTETEYGGKGERRKQIRFQREDSVEDFLKCGLRD